MSEIGINIQAGTSFGWGIVGLNLILQFLRDGNLAPVLTVPPGELDLPPADRTLFNQALDASGMILEFNEKNPGQPFILDIPLLYSGGNKFAHRLNVGSSRERYSITVFESSDLGDPQDSEKQYFQKIFAGSRWNAQILEEKGFQNVHVWNQGVDTTLFSPREVNKSYPGRFLIFSGGKLEYRKGQDLVIEAFRRFHQRHKEAMLVTAWDSPWSNIAASMSLSPWVSPPPPAIEGCRVNIRKWLASEGIPAECHLDLGAVPNRELPNILCQCDAAVLPSRAEGATNLVAMEAIACGIPTILSANTGHLDLLEEVPAIAIERQSVLPNAPPNTGVEGWGESEIDEIVEHLEWVYANPGPALENAHFALLKIQNRSWTERTKALGNLLNPL